MMKHSKNFKFKKADLGTFEAKTSHKVMKGFGPGCRIMGLTRGDFSLIDLIHAVLKKTGPAEVICTTWSAGIKDVHNVKWMMDSRLIKKFTLIVDYTYTSFKNKKAYALSCEDLFGAENIRSTNIHAKFVLIKNAEFNVCIRTSMNLNTNNKCEGFEIDEDAEIYAFYESFVSNVMDNQHPGFNSSQAAVNKPLDLFFGTGAQKQSIWSDL